MSLITRCPACGTMFKVVTDQLKVSQGWVRCGQCAEVFDASLHLQPREFTATAGTAPAPASVTDTYLQPAAGHEPAGWSPGVYFADRVGNAQAVPANQGLSPDPGPESSGFDPAGWKQQLDAPALDEAGRLRLNPLGEAEQVAPEVYAVPAHTDIDSEFDETPVSQGGARDSALPEDEEDGEDDEKAEAPHDVSFVRDARRKAFWRRPLVRVATALVCLVLAALLLLQVAIQQRDSIAAAKPELRPALQALCAQLHCEVAPLRRIEAIVIDSSSFNRIGADAYRLSFSLKNAGQAPLAMPSLEVTLTDIQDQALVRRVLSPSQFGAAGGMLAAGVDFSGVVAMKISADPVSGSNAASPAAAAPPRVAGYRMLAFYP